MEDDIDIHDIHPKTKSDGGEDPQKGGVKLPQSSNAQASFTLFKSFVGTGVLALPIAFKLAGLGLSILGVIFVGVLSYQGLMSLVAVADDKFGRQKVSYQKLAMELLGKKGMIVVQVSIIIMQAGACIGCLIFAKNFLNYAFCSFNVESLCDKYIFNLLFSLILTIPLAFINNMHYFYIPSLAATFFVLLALATQMFYNTEVLQKDDELRGSFGTKLGEFNFEELPLFFGTALYAFEGVGIIFSVRSSMEKPDEFSFVLKMEMLILGIIYTIFPTLSYMAFGDKTPDIILFSLPTSNGFYLLVQILYVMSALLSYPLQIFPAIRIIENSKSLRRRLFDTYGRCINNPLRYFIRFCIIGIIYLIAYTTKSFHLFINMLGSCVFTLLGFIMPTWFYHIQFRGRIHPLKKLWNYISTLIGIILGGIGFVLSVKKLAAGEHE